MYSVCGAYVVCVCGMCGVRGGMVCMYVCMCMWYLVCVYCSVCVCVCVCVCYVCVCVYVVCMMRGIE